MAVIDLDLLQMSGLTFVLPLPVFSTVADFKGRLPVLGGLRLLVAEAAPD